MSREMSYSPEYAEEAATHIDKMRSPYARFLAVAARTYAATLRQQAARVDEGMVRRACAAFSRMQGRQTSDCIHGGSHTHAEFVKAMRAALEAALSAQPAERQGDVETELSAWLQKEMPPGTVISNPAWWAKRIAGRVHLIRPAQPSPLLAKYQSCGCIVCTCEDEEQCQGCGAQHCGTHPVGQIPNPVYAQFPHPAAPVGVPDGWKLVPIDATPAMQAAGGHANSEWLNDNAPIGESRYGGPVMRSVWEAMLAAAPSAPQGVNRG